MERIGEHRTARRERVDDELVADIHPPAPSAWLVRSAG
jgi:hypothetical protein